MTTTTIIETTERPAERVLLAPAGRVSFTERLAMRIGLALILWSRDHAARETGAGVAPRSDVDAFRAASMRGLPIH